MRIGLVAQLLLALLCSAQTPAQERTKQFKALTDELHPAFGARVATWTQENEDDLLSRMHRIVQEEVLETLTRTEKAEDVRAAVRNLLGNGPYGNKGLPFVYSSNLQGLKTVVVGYYLTPNSGPKVMIDGFRKNGLAYGLAAETGDTLFGCDLQLEQLDSPRSNEAWFLAHGFGIGGSRRWEVMRIYSFDGFGFNELWSPTYEPLDPSITIAKDLVTIKYGDEYREPAMQDTIHLTVAGPVVTTTKRQP